jgi:hypothetical protein
MKLLIVISERTDMARATEIATELKTCGLKTPCDWSFLHDSIQRRAFQKQFKKLDCNLFIVPYSLDVNDPLIDDIRKFTESERNWMRFCFIEQGGDIRTELIQFTGLKL